MRQRRIGIGISLAVFCGIAIVYFKDDIRIWYRQYKAERFLKENMAGYGWTEDLLTDPRSGDTILFTPYDYETLYRAQDTLDSLRHEYRIAHTVYRDAELLGDDSIKMIVREAIKRWRESPYARHTNFDDFCEYLLPYRSGKEKLDPSYPDAVRDRYAYVSDSIPSDPIAAASLINDDMKRWMVFDLRSHALLSEPSASELMAEGKGSCRAISALFVQTMRAMGIPAAIDECPVWAHRNSGHEWTVVMDSTGKWRPFEPAEFNPDRFRSVCVNTRTPKIFRRTYSFDHSFYPPVERNDIPSYFTTFNRRDVTREYVSVSDVTVTPDRNLDKNNGVLYLAVFNAEEWRPVAWAKVDGDGKAVFRDMGNNDILYLPVFYRNGRNYPAGRPFVLDQAGKTRSIVADRDLKQSLDMQFVNLYWTTVWDTFAPGPGRQLEIFYWDDRWVFCDSTRVNPAPDYLSHFDNVPRNGLYLIKGREWANTWQRPFMADSVSEGSVWY